MKSWFAALGIFLTVCVPATAHARGLPASLLSPKRIGLFCLNSVNTTAAVDCWLAHHPTVAGAMWYEGANFSGTWPTWPASLKNRFHSSFDQMVLFYTQGMPAGYPQPIANPLPLQGPPDYTHWGFFLSESDGQTAYALLVANNIAAELTAAFPWSITTYTASQASMLLAINEVLGRWSGPPAVATPGYYLTGQNNYTIPAPPAYVVAFLRHHKVIASSAADTVVRLFTWEGNLSHFFVDDGVGTLELYDLFWGPPSPPVSVTSMIEGTTYTGPSGPWFAHWTLGCHGSMEFTKIALQTLNIPVQTKYRASHATPLFPTVDLALTHGDDPYSALDIVTPVPGFAVPKPAEFFVTISQYQSLCNPNWPDPTWCEHKVGIRPAIVAIKYASDYLVQKHCDDLAAGKTHAASSVLALLAFYFPELPLSHLQLLLEGNGLWVRLDAKAAAGGFCS